ncbi:phospholipase A1-Ibeta2, chloroplastic [Ananas comosus]|uniref:Phospholipase A1-Ibeta2, chloroplastic n=1 Tax=Ananas comosus TaxID=4615 RepID=A0A6P5FPG7_ANACO|nr:phospholipase A1-Ibeta2, chloroplastic [Ananas comosus]
MSPRSLSHLQRLLSESPRPSPRSSIAAAWRRYHGAESWDGLLDPLDPDLRRELLRYGDFVQSAYRAFEHSSSSSSSGHRHVVLPDRSYRATRSLFATSSLALPEWAHTHLSSAPDWLTQRSSWVGFVAVCDSDREIARMGRRDIAVVLRGTATCHEWAENLRTSLVPLPAAAAAAEPDLPRVARGFLSLYETPGERVPSLSSAIVDEVRRLLRLYEGEELSITVVGHSLGGALALLAADELRACAPRVPPIAVLSFGGPRVGDAAFADRLRRAGGVNVLRVVNAGDVVTRVPGAFASGRGYEHVGAELRVDSRDSPCLRPDAGPVCSHDLEAYLHLVDGFAGSGRDFRPDASRSVVRLLRHQRPSIKKVYANRALALRLDRPSEAPPEPYGYVASPS